MPGSRDHPQFAPAGVEHRARAESLAPQPKGRVKGTDRRPGQLREAGRARRVVGVPMGEHDLRHPPVPRARHLKDAAQVTLIVRARVDDEHR
jgi:hypothetical protein